MESKFNCLLPLTADACKFTEWVVQQDEWFFNNHCSVWEKYGWRDRTTQELFEFWQKESGNGD